jgi:ribonuclease HII
MHRAIQKLDPPPAFILVDGNRFNPYPGISYLCIVDGDALYKSIAAASILAKTYRDDYMQKLHKEYPQYGWDSNKGYATAGHRKAIREYGISPYHRRSFRLDEQLRFF